VWLRGTLRRILKSPTKASASFDSYCRALDLIYFLQLFSENELSFYCTVVLVLILRKRRSESKMDYLPPSATVMIDEALEFIYSFGPLAEKTLVLGK